MPDVIQTNQRPEVKVDKMLEFAQHVANGKFGGNYIYCLGGSCIYHYDQGVWKGVEIEEFLDVIQKGMPETMKETLNRRLQIIENFKIIKYKKIQDFNWTSLITLENEMLNPYDGTTEPHDPIYYSTVKLNYKYDENAKCPLWKSSLYEIFEGDRKKIEILQEFFGYCLVPDIEQKKALLLLGESNTGKSTLLFALQDLIGEENCANIPLKHLSNPQYLPMLVGKFVNIDADVDKNAENYEAEFRLVTGGDVITCNQKFVKTFKFAPKAKMVLAANTFPKITDHTSAFYNRLILLPCDRVFQQHEMNKKLRFQLKAELPGILNWAIEGLKRMKARGMFEDHDFMKDAVKELEDENNPSNGFFEEHIEIDMTPDLYIEKGELYNKYKMWCVETKNYTLSKAKFSMCVYKKFHTVTPKTTMIKESGKRIWKHLKYVENKGQQAIENKGWQD